MRLLMNPVTMLGSPLEAEDALTVIETELAGQYKGAVVLSRRPPDPAVIGRAKGHRQVMDFWLVQVARDSSARLATSDAGTATNWSEHTVKVG